MTLKLQTKKKKKTKTQRAVESKIRKSSDIVLLRTRHRIETAIAPEDYEKNFGFDVMLDWLSSYYSEVCKNDASGA